MTTKIKIVFKDNQERVFDANRFTFNKDGFCDLEFYEDNKKRLDACVAMDEIKYLRFVEVE
ncbi:hypothetical protein ACU68Y_00225 [Finegoldia sp. P1-F-LS]|uniref:hypothetical protein n=1 Tax=unclassified Finegoldia TaxID=2619637 RepID=UPI00406C58B5